MTLPDHLSKGDRIGIVSTARKVNELEIQPCKEVLMSWGLEVVLGANLYKEQHQYAGTDGERIADMQFMLSDPSIKAIICARGGYGTVRIVDALDFSGFVNSPKWIIGFSDVTVLHSHIHANYDLATLHAPMAINFAESESLDELRKALFGERLSYSFLPNAENRAGNCTGEVIGGNLSILYSLMASKSQMDTSGKILFLEDIDEYLYHIDRMMQNLKRAGFLKNLAGLMVGGMTDMNDNEIKFGSTAGEIIAKAVAEYSYPVAFDFPAGHTNNNLPLILGAEAELVVENSGCNLNFL